MINVYREQLLLQTPGQNYFCRTQINDQDKTKTPLHQSRSYITCTVRELWLRKFSAYIKMAIATEDLFFSLSELMYIRWTRIKILAQLGCTGLTAGRAAENLN